MLNEGLHPKEDINLGLPVAIFSSFRESLLEEWGRVGGGGSGEKLRGKWGEGG